jgi:hypothetical protein
VTDGSLSQSFAAVDAGTEGDWYIWNRLDVLDRKIQCEDEIGKMESKATT